MLVYKDRLNQLEAESPGTKHGFYCGFLEKQKKSAAAHAEKIGRILARLNEAGKVQDMGLPGLKLHPLKGDRAGNWSVWVSGN